MREWSGDALIDRVRSGDPRAIARAISAIEDRDAEAQKLVRALYPLTGRAQTIGVTGPPGVGKSTLIAAIVRMARHDGRTVGVVSVDPSSSFTGGALLGDRIRLSEHGLDTGVFIRSMATRGHTGGIAEATLLAALVLDAAGKELVLTETTGVGQGEVQVAQVCDTVVLVLMPGAGDVIQALKAGIMEIPDVVVVNKSDHPQAAGTAGEVRAVLGLAPASARATPVVLTDAVHGDGLEELAGALAEHRSYLGEEGRLEERRRKGIRAQVVALAAARVAKRVEQATRKDAVLRSLLEHVERREIDPLSAVNELVDRMLASDQVPHVS